MKSENKFISWILSACVYLVELMFVAGFMGATWFLSSRVISSEVARGFAFGIGLMFWLWLHRAMNVLRAWEHSSSDDLTTEMEKATMTVKYYERTRKFKSKLENNQVVSDSDSNSD